MNSESLSTRQVLEQDYCHHDALVTLQVWSNEKEIGIRVSTLVILSARKPDTPSFSSSGFGATAAVSDDVTVCAKESFLAAVKVDNKLDDKC